MKSIEKPISLEEVFIHNASNIFVPKPTAVEIDLTSR